MPSETPSEAPSEMPAKRHRHQTRGGFIAAAARGGCKWTTITATGSMTMDESERDWRRENKAGGRGCLLVGCLTGEDVMSMDD